MKDASFPMLIWRIANKYHRGVVLQMARHTRLDYATLRKWIFGLTRQPDTPNVEQFCEAYGLDFQAVYDIIRRDIMRYRMRARVPVPDLSHVKPRPLPDGQNRRPLARMDGGRRRKVRVA